MSMRIMFVLYLILVALVSINAVYVLGWPLWADIVLLGVTAISLAAVVAVAVLNRAVSGHGRMLVSLQMIGVFGLVLVAGTLAIPAWQVLGANADAGASGVGRMAPMFLTALALYGVNLWLDAAESAREQVALQRIARLVAGPRLLPALITALLLTAGLILALDWIGRGVAGAEIVTHRFLDRGIIPPITALLFLWGLLLLFGKRWNIWYLHRALQHWDQGRSASGTRPMIASLETLATPGTGLEESIALLWQRYEESYLFPRYISWAVPVLGFIGTVLGISLAADGIRRIIGSDAGLSGLSSDLSGAIAPLGIAFDTTLIALSLSVVLTLLLSVVQRDEERVLARLEWKVRGAGRAG